MANVFISYARRDRDRVAKLTEALESEGLSVWWDSDLVPGRRYRTIIAEQLAVADSVIVVWTTAALDSDWVQDEAEEARQRGVLIPVTLELVRPPAGFRQVQAADLSQWTGAPQHPDFRSLLFAIRSLVQVAEAQRRTAPAPTPGQVMAPPKVAVADEPETEPQPPRLHPLSGPPEPQTAAEAPAPMAATAADPPPVVAETAAADHAIAETLASPVPMPAVTASPAGAVGAEPPLQPARPSLNTWLVGIAFSVKSWLAAAAVLVLSVMALNGHSSNVTPYYFVVAPLAAAAIASAGARVGLGWGARLSATWASLVVGLLGSLIIDSVSFLGSSARAVYVVFIPIFFFVIAAGGVFVLVAGLGLLTRGGGASRGRQTTEPPPQARGRRAP